LFFETPYPLFFRWRNPYSPLVDLLCSSPSAFCSVGLTLKLGAFPSAFLFGTIFRFLSSRRILFLNPFSLLHHGAHYDSAGFRQKATEVPTFPPNPFAGSLYPTRLQVISFFPRSHWPSGPALLFRSLASSLTFPPLAFPLSRSFSFFPSLNGSPTELQAELPLFERSPSPPIWILLLPCASFLAFFLLIEFVAVPFSRSFFSGIVPGRLSHFTPLAVGLLVPRFHVPLTVPLC